MSYQQFLNLKYDQNEALKLLKYYEINSSDINILQKVYDNAFYIAAKYAQFDVLNFLFSKNYKLTAQKYLTKFEELDTDRFDDELYSKNYYKMKMLFFDKMDVSELSLLLPRLHELSDIKYLVNKGIPISGIVRNLGTKSPDVVNYVLSFPTLDPYNLRVAFQEAIKNPHNMDVINSFLNYGIDFELLIDGNTLLQYISTLNIKHDRVCKIIKYGGDLNVLNNKNQNVFMSLIIGGYNDYKLVKLMIDKGADYLCIDIYGNTVLHYLNNFNNLPTLKYLLSVCPDYFINHKNNNNETAFMLAEYKNNTAYTLEYFMRGAARYMIDYGKME